MADRVSASIVVGGTLTAPEHVELAEIIADEGLSIEWDGERFEPEHRTAGEPRAVFELERTFGPTITISAGRVLPARLIGQQHVLELSASLWVSPIGSAAFVRSHGWAALGRSTSWSIPLPPRSFRCKERHHDRIHRQDRLLAARL